MTKVDATRVNSQLKTLAQKNYKAEAPQSHLLGRILDDIAATSGANNLDPMDLLNAVTDHLSRLQGM